MEYEDRLRISTPEGVDLELTLAGIGSRFIAALIDLCLRLVLWTALVAGLAGVNTLVDGRGVVGIDSDGVDALAVAVLSIAAFLIIFAYDILFEVRGGGRTPGKRLAGLRVVRASGRPVGFVTSAIRNILRVLDFLPAVYTLGLGVMFVSKRNQRLGDMAAGTVVIRERTGGRTPPPVGIAGGLPAAEPATAGWDVSAVTAAEVATVRRFLERRATLTDAARSELAADLAARLRPKVAGAPEHLASEPFLEQLSAAKAARSES